MKRLANWAAVAAILAWCHGATAQELVHFPSLEDNGPGQASTMLDGYLYRPPGEGRHPAIVGLHGCSGMFSRDTGLIGPLYREWAGELTRRGYVVLIVDSFRPRNIDEMCSPSSYNQAGALRRPKDAYG